MSNGKSTTEGELLADAIATTFTYHEASANQIARYGSVRMFAKALAVQIMEHCPDGSDRETALRRLRECVMWANASIALEGINHV